MNAQMHVAELWRYPVKSMGGERLQSAELSELGIRGDRVLHVRGANGKMIDARAHPLMLGHRCTFAANGASGGDVQVDGRAWDSPDVARDVERAAGAGARIVRSDGFSRFDVLPLLVATDGAIAAFGRDGRRLRPNIVIGGVEGLAEREWEGRALRIGDAVIGVRNLRGRCVMTTYDPDTLEQDQNVLRRIVSEFGGTLALDCWVIRGGVIRINDAVELLPAAPQDAPAHVFGRYA